MKIKAAIGSPLYEVKHFYGKPKPVKQIKEGCKKNLLLSITIEEVSDMNAQKIFNRILEDISALYGEEKLTSLADHKWAEDEMKEWDNGLQFKNCICVPKDFDHLEEQKKLLLKTARDTIRSVKVDMEYFEPFLRVKNDNFANIF